eukprot:COSAG05_NODE_2197_length_3410_cov_7.529447_1_plen_59_part_00
MMIDKQIYTPEECADLFPEEGGSGMVGTEAVVVIIVVVYSLYGDGVLAIAGPAVARIP